MTTPNSIGYIKYDGELVQNGIIDARSAARALSGFDKAIRYFLKEQNEGFADANFPIPVTTQKGSWTIEIPQTIDTWLKIAAGAGLTTFFGAYANEAAKKMAGNDFANIGLKDVFKKSLQAVVWLVKIGKHYGSLKQKKTRGIRWSSDGSEVGIPNEKGEMLYIPVEFFEMYLEAPKSILNDLSSVVEEKRMMLVGVDINRKFIEETILLSDRAIFCLDDEIEPTVICPDLTHGKYVELVGIVTRGNEVSNTIGFRYDSYILTSSPTEGKITRYKSCLFLPCKIKGVISREDDAGTIAETNRPHIIFSDLVVLDDGNEQAKLL